MTTSPAPSPSATTPAAAPLAPPLKWVGGKTRLLPHILPHYSGQRRLVEPFIGGGAVSFHLAGTVPGLHVVANDFLEPLVGIYKAIQTDPETLIARVEQLADGYLACEGKLDRRAHFYMVRDAYNAAGVDDPATLLFLLRTCVSGMYRTSKRTGLFNTGHAFGAEEPGFHQPARIRGAATAMRTWTLTSGDFAQTLPHVDADTFLFLDAPYRSTFTGYTAAGFDDHDQQRVVAFAKEAAARGAQVVYTNKDTGDGFYERAFPGWTIERVPIRYSVNANRAQTGCPETQEVIVSN